MLANPITVIKTRLEVVGFSEYSGVVDACRKIYAQEGAGAAPGTGVASTLPGPHASAPIKRVSVMWIQWQGTAEWSHLPF